ncbi:hypothetical protein ACJMK2_025475, partial [Sinanodonta woodiana]
RASTVDKRSAKHLATHIAQKVNLVEGIRNLRKRAANQEEFDWAVQNIIQSQV